MCLLIEEISIIMGFSEYHPRYFLNQLYYQKKFLPLFIDPHSHKDFHKKSHHLKMNLFLNTI